MFVFTSVIVTVTPGSALPDASTMLPSSALHRLRAGAAGAEQNERSREQTKTQRTRREPAHVCILLEGRSKTAHLTAAC